MLHSPGTKRALPPPIPTNIQTMMDLMGLSAVWTQDRRFILTYEPQGTITSQQMWGTEGGDEEAWMQVLSIISDQIAAMQAGTFGIKKEVPRRVAIEWATAAIDAEQQRKYQRVAGVEAELEQEETGRNVFADAVLGTQEEHGQQTQQQSE